MIFEAVFLVLWVAVAWVIRLWAEYLGKPTLPYFLSSLFLTPLLPAFVLLFKGPEPWLIEEVAIAEGKSKRCIRCTEAIRAGALVCKFCGSEQPSL